MTEVSVVIPTYNESSNIRSFLIELREVLCEQSESFELLVVDDDSPDGTWRIAQNLAEAEPNVKVIRRFTDKGLAKAVKEGFRQAQYEYVAVMDADFQHPPDRLSDLIAALDRGADVAVGSRFLDESGIEDWSWRRIKVSTVAHLFATRCCPSVRETTDPLSGFFATRLALVENAELQPKGYKILLELLVRADPERVVDVPYVFRDRRRGNSNLSFDQYRKFVEHACILGLSDRNVDRLLSPSKAVRAVEFAIVGGIGAILNMFIFSILTLILSLNYLFAGAAAFVVALNWNFVGNWAITFDKPKVGLWSKYVQFSAVSLIGFATYTLILAGVIDVLALPKLLANGVAILGAATINFLGTDNVVFDVSGSDVDSVPPSEVVLTSSVGDEESSQTMGDEWSNAEKDGGRTERAR